MPGSIEDTRLRAWQGRRRGTLFDCLIAATAIAEDAELATANPRDFQQLRCVRLA